MLAVALSLPQWARCRLILPMLLLLSFATGFVATAPVQAAQGVTWDRFDVDLELQPDGSYRVKERQEIRFEGSSYSSGFATIPLDRIESIDSILVSEERDGEVIPYEPVPWSSYDDDPETYSAHEVGSDVEIVWGFPETRNESRIFLIEYNANGALRVYSDETGTYEQIWWTAVSKDVTEIGDVEQSTVTVRLPKAVDPTTVLLGEDAEERPEDHTTDGRTWTWTKQNLEAGDEFIVRMEFPAIVGASPPSWQQADDQQRLNEEKSDDRQSLIDVAFLGIGLLSLVLGGAGVYGLWYTRGRDPHTGIVADFIPEPPDDLPPGAAGALIDEIAHEHDIVATVVDLGRRGVIKIEQDSETAQPVKIGGDFTLTVLQAEPKVTDFERSLLHALFGSALAEGATEKMSRARSRFSSSAEFIKDQMYGELVKRGYFTSSPEATRDRWRKGSIIAAVVLFLVACFGSSLLADISVFIFFPIAIAAIVAVGLVFLSRALPKKTPSGAEASAKWRAFRRYLSDIEKYDRLNESQQIFDQYLPYAVAFGLEETWVAKFAATGAQPPAWYGPVIINGPRDWSRGSSHRRQSYGGSTWRFPNEGGSSSSSGGGSGRGFNFPDMQDMSDRAGGGLQSTSSSLFDMLSSAAEAFGDFSSSGSGGRRNWGGGGGGYRGGGGGRRSGGGSRRSGSSGGGRRGFR